MERFGVVTASVLVIGITIYYFRSFRQSNTQREPENRNIPFETTPLSSTTRDESTRGKELGEEFDDSTNLLVVSILISTTIHLLLFLF